MANLFLTSHADGTVLIWDKEREDWGGFVPNVHPIGKENLNGRDNDHRFENGGNGNKNTGYSNKTSHHHASDEFLVSRPDLVDKRGVSTTKFNPVSHWKISKKPITG